MHERVRPKQRKLNPVPFLRFRSDSLMGDELLSEDDDEDLSNFVFPVKSGDRPTLANRQLPLAVHRPRPQAYARPHAPLITSRMPSRMQT